ncbi:MAG: CerR family C-terminal domain-containing protein [Tepidisphaeraceae bacterium]|jgi:AcrR family transcriptional regulator
MSDAVHDHSVETRGRLLDAAGEVFALKGFADATIREICGKAQANIAAVNYHFGDKQKLYAAVFAHLRLQADEGAGPPDGAVGGSAEDRLRGFIRQFLKGLLGPGRPSWSGRLMAREMSEPTGVFQSFVEDHIRPREAILQAIIREIVGELPPRVIAKCSVSVVGQMMHYHFARPVLKGLSPIYADLDQHVEELADHVTRFSLGGLRAIADRYRKGQLER